MHRVSDILRLYWPKMWASQDDLDGGSYRHDLIEEALFDRDFSALGHEPKLVGLKDWLDRELIDVLFLEEEMSNGVHGYIGHIDAMLTTRTYGTAIFDWKSNPRPTTSNLMQAQAYANFTWPIGGHPCHLVHLCGNTVHVTKFKRDDRLWAGFQYGLKVLQFRDSL